MSLLIELLKLIVYKGDNWTVQRNINKELRRITQHDYIEYVKDVPITVREVTHLPVTYIKHSDLFLVKFNVEENRREVLDCSVDDELVMSSYCVSWEKSSDDNVKREKVRKEELVEESNGYMYDCLITQSVYKNRFSVNSIEECPVRFNSLRMLDWLQQEQSILVVESMLYYMATEYKIKKTKTYGSTYGGIISVSKEKNTLQEVKKYYEDFLTTLIK